MNKLSNYFTGKFPSLVSSDDSVVEVYSSVPEEFNTLKYGAGIYDRSLNTVLKLSGKDVSELLERISTNDIGTLENYHYINTLFLNEKSRLIDRTTLIKFDEEYFLIGGKDKLFRLQRWIEKYTINEEIEIENITGEYFIAEVIGPQAESYLTLICGEELNKLTDNKLHRIEIEDLGFYLLKKETLHNEKIFWIISEIGNGNKIIDYMLNNISVFDVSMVGVKAFEAYRIKNVIPVFPNEINDKYNPYEAGLMKELSETKENFIGYELIHQLRITGEIKRKLKYLKLKGNVIAKVPFELKSIDGTKVCEVTSITEAKETDNYNCLAYVEKEFIDEKKIMEVKISDENTFLQIKIKD